MVTWARVPRGCKGSVTLMVGAHAGNLSQSENKEVAFRRPWSAFVCRSLLRVCPVRPPMDSCELPGTRYVRPAVRADSDKKQPDGLNESLTSRLTV